MIQFYHKHKKTILLIIGVILLALILSGGNYAYILHESEIEQLESDKITLSRKLDSIKLLQEINESKIPEIRNNQKNYYYEYKQAQQRAINAEESLKSIIYRRYSIAYLDSLAKHIEYRD